MHINPVAMGVERRNLCAESRTRFHSSASIDYFVVVVVARCMSVRPKGRNASESIDNNLYNETEKTLWLKTNENENYT